MAAPSRAPTPQTYLVEHYRPGATATDLERVASRVRAAFEELELEGQAARFRHATVVAIDESLFCVVEASSEELVRLAYHRANETFERMSAARTEPS